MYTRLSQETNINLDYELSDLHGIGLWQKMVEGVTNALQRIA